MKIEETGPSPLVFAHAKSWLKATNGMPKIEMLPYLSNLCFAIELLLKSISVKFLFERKSTSPEDNTYSCESLIRDNRHDILKLFEQLEDTAKNRMANNYERETGRDIKSDLAKYRTTFIDLRYAYEKLPKTIQAKQLEELSGVIYQFARETIGPSYLDTDDLK